MSGIPSSLQTTLGENWTNLSSWIAGNLTAASLSAAVGGQTTITSNTTLGVCSLMDPMSTGVSDVSPGYYEESGAGTITYSGMSVSTLGTITPTAAQVSTADGASIDCPVGVSQIVVSGSYSYTQGCQEYDGVTGKAMGDPIPATGNGAFTQTVNDAVITWTLQYDPTSSQVSLAGVSVIPTPSVTVTEASTGSGFLDFFQNLFDSAEVSALEGGMVDVLQNSAFTQALVAEFNAALTQSATGTSE